MDKFQNKLNFNFGINQQIIKEVSFIDSFRGKWNLVEQKENNYLKELLENMEITKLVTRDQQEVVGYYDVLEIIYESYSDIRISQN